MLIVFFFCLVIVFGWLPMPPSWWPPHIVFFFTEHATTLQQQKRPHHCATMRNTNTIAGCAMPQHNAQHRRSTRNAVARHAMPCSFIFWVRLFFPSTHEAPCQGTMLNATTVTAEWRLMPLPSQDNATRLTTLMPPVPMPPPPHRLIVVFFISYYDCSNNSSSCQCATPAAVVLITACIFSP